MLACDPKPIADFETDGQLLRLVTPDDEMIINRINRFRDRAFLACSRLVKEKEFAATLVDVEHLFDGQSLYFYFLGEVTPELESLTAELSEAYESKVRFRKFTETLINGCGPDCGTGDACSDSGCQTCALSGGCKSA